MRPKYVNSVLLSEPYETRLGSRAALNQPRPLHSKDRL